MRDLLFLLLVAIVLLSTVSHAWLLPQTRREIIGTMWTTTMTTLLDPTMATPEKYPEKYPMSHKAAVDDKDRAKREKKEQQEHDRIARETKARLAAGRIGTI